MLASLSWAAWLLIISALGLGLGIVLVFFFANRKRGKTG